MKTDIDSKLQKRIPVKIGRQVYRPLTDQIPNRHQVGIPYHVVKIRGSVEILKTEASRNSPYEKLDGPK